MGGNTIKMNEFYEKKINIIMQDLPIGIKKWDK